MLSVLVINSDSDTIVSDNGTGWHLWPRTFFRPWYEGYLLFGTGEWIQNVLSSTQYKRSSIY